MNPEIIKKIEKHYIHMRKALESALPIMRDCPFTHYNTTEVDKVVEEIKSALAEPSRNLDRFNTPDEALSAYCEDKGITKQLPLWYGDEFWEFINWLFAEVKGEQK